MAGDRLFVAVLASWVLFVALVTCVLLGWLWSLPSGSWSAFGWLPCGPESLRHRVRCRLTATGKARKNWSLLYDRVSKSITWPIRFEAVSAGSRPRTKLST